MNFQDFPRLSDLPEKYRITENNYQDYFLANGRIIKHKNGLNECFSPIFIYDDDKLIQFKIGDYPEFNVGDSLGLLEGSLGAWNAGDGEWQLMSQESRIASVERFLDLSLAKRDTIIKYLMWETAKNLPESIAEFDRTIDYTRHTIDALKRLLVNDKEKISISGFTAKVEHTPVGVVLCMGPSNYPFYETYSIVFPALLTGNCVVLKVPRLGALFHKFLYDEFLSCFPPGVVNFLYGSFENTVYPIMETGKIDMLAYFGNSEAANEIIKKHPNPSALKTLLGTEAKNPAVIFPETDFNLAVREAVLGSLAFNGQRCAALKILYVHQEIYDAFCENLAESVINLKKGMPWEEGVKITPVSDPSRIQYFDELVDDALSKGARLLTGGKSSKSAYEPVVLADVTSGMRIFNEEQFGPIIPVVRFGSIEQVIAHITASKFGQQLSIFGKKTPETDKLISAVKNQVSRINLNCKCQRGPDELPFTGRKNSGNGILSITDTLYSFSEKHVIAGKTSAAENSSFLD